MRFISEVYFSNFWKCLNTKLSLCKFFHLLWKKWFAKRQFTNVKPISFVFFVIGLQKRANSVQIFDFFVLIFTLPTGPVGPPLPLPPTCDVHACPRGATGMYIASWGKGERGGIKWWAQNYGLFLPCLFPPFISPFPPSFSPLSFFSFCNTLNPNEYMQSLSFHLRFSTWSFFPTTAISQHVLRNKTKLHIIISFLKFPNQRNRVYVIILV